VSPSRIAADFGVTTIGVTKTNASELVSRTEARMAASPNVPPRIRPAESTLATSGLAVAQTILGPWRVSPRAFRTVALSRTVSRTRSSLIRGLRMMRVGGMTARSTSVEAQRVDARIRVAPSSMPVTSPEASTRATRGEELVHTTFVSTGRGLPASVTEATNRIVSPRPMLAAEGDTATRKTPTGSELSRQVDRARGMAMTIVR
jgi:hypothetical protein